MKSRRIRSRHNKKHTKNMTHKQYGGKPGKKWITAIEAARKTLHKTGSYKAATRSLKKQALTNARKLFGSVSNM